MTNKTYPDYHKALLDQNLYPSASRRIKFEETRLSYLYRTGEASYKIRKTGSIYSSLAIKEAFCQEALRLGKRWAPDCEFAVVPIRKAGDHYTLAGEGETVDYALRMTQLNGHHWADELQRAGKLNPTAVGRLARFLAAQHEAHAVDERTAAEAGRPEHLRGLVEEVAYQVKKYFGGAVTPPMFELMARPLEKFFEESRRLFLRRQKKGRIVDGHGAFVPEHLFLPGKEVVAVSPLEAHPKYRLLDAASDVALFLNGASLLGDGEIGELFLKRYLTASHDRELVKILPAYQTFQAMRCGLQYNEWIVEGNEPPQRQAELARQAHDCYNLAVQRAREIPRSA